MHPITTHWSRVVIFEDASRLEKERERESNFLTINSITLNGRELFFFSRARFDNLIKVFASDTRASYLHTCAGRLLVASVSSRILENGACEFFTFIRFNYSFMGV